MVLPVLGEKLPPVPEPLDTMAFLELPVAEEFEVAFAGSSDLPLFEQERQTLKTDFSIKTFLVISVRLPHNSQETIINNILLSNLLGFVVSADFFVW